MPHLVQILLPLTDKANNKFPQSHYTNVKSTLTDKFGGVTVFMRAPAEGIWEKSNDKVERDHIAIFEVMAETLDKNWWHDYRRQLEELFQQDKIIIRAQEIELI